MYPIALGKTFDHFKNDFFCVFQNLILVTAIGGRLKPEICFLPPGS